MKDHLGREIDYMRISITDRCNLRCRYCMPEGAAKVSVREILSLEEAARLAACGAVLGIRKIKVTGGEPLVRLGCCDFVRMLKETPGIQEVTITTNGMLLEEYLDPLVQAGIDGINISLDTLDPELYAGLTGGGELGKVLKSIRRSADAGSERHFPVKINAVSLDMKEVAPQLGCGYGGGGWQELLQLAADYPVDVRFIEMMPIGWGKLYQAVDHRVLLDRLRRIHPKMEEDHRRHGNGPAVYYRIPGFQGSIGFISAVHGKFCGSCNRVRLTSEGYLKSCLCYEDGVDLKPILRGSLPEDEKEERLAEAMRQAVWNKPGAHCFENPEQMTEYGNMASIGG